MKMRGAGKQSKECLHIKIEMREGCGETQCPHYGNSITTH